MENKNERPRRIWDLMIGIALVIFGGLRLYNRLQSEAEWDFRSIITILFMGYGGYMIYRHFQAPPKE